ncbi:Phosphoglycerate mutase-like protein [Drosera capensis]
MRFSGEIYNMDSSGGGIGLYPLHRSKTIHLVRYAQGFHNVAGEKNHDAYLSYDYLDATLTPLGWEQVDNLRKHVRDSLVFSYDFPIEKVQLVTMQTAAGAFGGGVYVNGIDVPPLMVENAGNSGRLAISCLNCPPLLANELCREQIVCLSLFHPLLKHELVLPGVGCATTLEKDDWMKRVWVGGTDVYPLGFIHVTRGVVLASRSHCLLLLIFHWQVDTDEDTLWREDVRETKKDVAARGLKFMNWLLTRKEKKIVVVGHSSFLFNTLNQFGNDCHPLVKSEFSTQEFGADLPSDKTTRTDRRT